MILVLKKKETGTWSYLTESEQRAADAKAPKVKASLVPPLRCVERSFLKKEQCSIGASATGCSEVIWSVKKEANGGREWNVESRVCACACA